MITQDLTERVKNALADQYEVEREVGRGGMATVFLARERGLGRHVAIKVLEPMVATDIARERFLREVEFASRLNHPNIVPIFSAGQADDLLYYVMPYIEGHSLRVRLARDGRLAFDDAIQITAEVADALHYAHSQGVIHRDIKPENVLISNGHAVVADFGIARAFCAACDDNLTVAGMPIGTPGYMSPEQGSGEEVDPRTDVYSLGAILFEMLTGKPPFRGPTIEAIIAARYTQPTPTLRGEGWTLSDTIDRAVQRALAIDREERFGTAREFLETIRPRVSGEITPATLPGEVVPGPSRDTRTDRSIAVLPFANLSTNADNEYFSDGITEDIIALLSKIKGVRVTSRTSVAGYRKTTKSAPDIAKELGVATILEGSVRRAGNRVRVVAQLIDARADQHVWAESYDRELTDIFAIQDEIAEQIAVALKTQLTPDDKAQLGRKPTDNLDAYNLYLEGRFHWAKFTREGIRRGIELFNRAAELDPTYALAYAGLADAYILLVATLTTLPPHEGMPKAKAAAEKALEMDPELADARASLAAVRDWYDWDFDEAEREYRRALELDPRAEKTRIMYAFHLWIRGRGEEALEFVRRAETECPTSLVARTQVALNLYKLRRYDEAVAQVQSVVERDADFPPAFMVLTWTYLKMGMTAEALKAATHAANLTGNAPPRRAAIGVTLAARGQLAQAEGVLDELIRRSESEYVSPLDLALLASYLGRPDDAFAYLDRAAEERSPWIAHLKHEPLWDFLREDPRFEALTERLGLP